MNVIYLKNFGNANKNKEPFLIDLKIIKYFQIYFLIFIIIIVNFI